MNVITICNLAIEMAIMAQWCCIAVIRIRIMNWSAFCWYHLYLIVTHYRRDSIGHGVKSCQKYSLKNDDMARPSGIMQSQVSINPSRNPQKGRLTPKHRLGRPRQPTLQDDRQLLQWVCNGRTKSATAPQRRMAAAHKRTLIPTANQQPDDLSRR